MPRYHGLRIYTEAKRLTVATYRCVRSFPDHERFGLISQLTRAAVSVGANVVEGQRRATTKDYRNFVCNAEGSLAELQYLLEIAKELDYLTQESFDAVWQQSIEVEKMLQALRLGLDRKMHEQAATPPAAEPVTRNP